MLGLIKNSGMIFDSKIILSSGLNSLTLNLTSVLLEENLCNLLINVNDNSLQK
jgi:hypothetical protein